MTVGEFAEEVKREALDFSVQLRGLLRKVPGVPREDLSPFEAVRAIGDYIDDLEKSHDG